VTLMDDLNQFKGTPPKSKVCLILDGAQPEHGDRAFTSPQLEELKLILADSGYTSSSIHRMFKSRGFEISENSVRRYRRDLQSKIGKS